MAETYEHVKKLVARVNGGPGLRIEQYDDTLHEGFRPGQKHAWEGFYSGLEAETRLSEGLTGNLWKACMAARAGERQLPKIKVRGVFNGHWHDLTTTKGVMEFDSTLRHPDMRREGGPNIAYILASDYSIEAREIVHNVYNALFPLNMPGYQDGSSDREKTGSEKWGGEDSSDLDGAVDRNCKGLPPNSANCS